MSMHGRMVGVLEGLDDIAWDRLGHAYGAASDVPEQLRALRSDDEAARTRAWQSLSSNIFHQSTRYEASAYAVPFLIELVADPATRERARLLDLLAGLAIGYDQFWIPEGIPISEHRRDAEGGADLAAAGPHIGDEPEDVEPDEEDDDGEWEVDDGEALYGYLESLSPEDQHRYHAHIAVVTYDAVRAGVATFRALLDADDREVVTMAAYLLGWFPEEAAGSRPRLAAVAAQGPPEVRATALVALGLLDTPPGPVGAADDPLVHCAAALARARTARENTDPAAVSELLAWVRGTRTSDLPFPYLEGDPAGYAALALRQLGPAHVDAAFDALLDRIPAVTGSPALPVVSQGLRIAFGEGGRERVPFADLDERQQRLVRALAESPRTGQYDGMSFGNFLELIRWYGLPPELPDYVAGGQS
jgi:hypothetical protein